MARRRLAAGQAQNDATTYETVAFQPGPNTLILLFVTSLRASFAQGPPIPTVAGNGLVWVNAQSVIYGANSDRRLTCFRASGTAPIGGAAVIGFGNQTQDFCAWSIVEFDNVDVSQANGESAVAQLFPVIATGVSLTAALSPSADPTRNFVVGAIAVDSAATAEVSVSPGPGFTEIDELDVTQFLGRAGTLQTQDGAASNSSINWSWNTTQSAAAIVVEIRTAPPAGTGTGTGTGTAGHPTDDDKLVKRFEPVLFFHPQENFFPSDAKRYIEHAALWTAQAPEEDKNGWGGVPGGPFPRNPTVPAMGLAAVSTEPGAFRFGESLGAGNDYRFLELGGWKDSTEAHESGVTATSTNLYSDRSAIETLYGGVLEPSRFWYHAEVIHEGQLRTIGSGTPGVDLSRIMGRFSTPTLLCYYLFYPAHDQSVGSDTCTGIEAKEVSCHAGDWQCIAILGEGVGDAFTPKFFGRTGSLPTSPFPAYQYDDDEATAMMVAAWTGTEPEVTDGHPRFYVAKGSHTLYTMPGDQAVDPYPDPKKPSWCGTLDTPTPAGPSDDANWEESSTIDVLIFLAKMAAGGTLGPFGIKAALAACIVELANIRFVPTFGAEAPPPNPADPDSPPASAAAGKTVKPAGLTVHDAGSDVVEWRSQRDLHLDGRVYDCVLDRTAQPWWPSADTKSGFNGRWGQHVTADGLSRRAGPRFPNYPRMFLMALADGDGKGILNLGTDR